MKIIILGSSGMLGSCLKNKLVANNEVIGISRKTKNDKYECDFKNLKALENILDKEKADIIINCAAITDLQYCEKNINEAFSVHYYLSNFLSKRNERNIYISTDSVFDGSVGWYKEESIVKPLNVYAMSKYMGEMPIIQNGGLVIRVNIFGFNSIMKRSSLFEWMCEQIKLNNKVIGYTNIIFNPVSIFKLAEIMEKMIERNINGLINIGSNEAISKADFLNKIVNIVDEKYKGLSLGELSETVIIRPKNTTLSTQKFKGYGFNGIDIYEDLSETIRKYNEYY